MSWECRIIIQNCTGCGICADVCTFGAITMTRSMAYPESVAGKCSGCRKCVRQCPFDAVEIERIRERELQPELRAGVKP